MAILDQSATVASNDWDFSGVGSAAWCGQSFTPSETDTLEKVTLYLKKTGSATGTLYVYLYSNSSGSPGSSLASAVTLDVSTLTTSYQEIDFTFATKPELTASTLYWFVIKYVDGSAGNRAVMGWEGSGFNFYAGGSIKACSDGVSWNLPWATQDIYFKQYRTGPTGGPRMVQFI